MARIVMKFGGTSVADLDRIAHVAQIVAAAARSGERPAVVVSAMAGETNKLVDYVRRIGPPAQGLGGGQDEYDAVVASGEQVSAGLTALALRAQGLRARSWLGWQAGVRTTGVHGQARIQDIAVDPLAQAVDDGEIAVLAGFQGAGPDGRITTLGRGGSDTSAVALAAALEADRCDIFTDVDGVYTTDPRIERRARRIDRISYEEMLEMASLGAKVLQTRSVELAMAKSVRLRVLSSFLAVGAPNPGTLVCEEDDIMEKRIVSGVAYSRDDAKITLLGLADHPGVAARVFQVLADEHVNVDMIVQSRARSAEAANMEFTVGGADLDRAVAILERRQTELSFESLTADADVAKISEIGLWQKSHLVVSQTMFTALADRGINIQVISTSEIKISVLIDAEYTELAVRALHAAYGLDRSRD
ncbi:MAG: aspartate kinase [Maricaulaceae bacterium]